MSRKRGEAYLGHGYGTQRYVLYQQARNHLKRCYSTGYYLEAITILESLIADRLESRISYLKGENVGFSNLGRLISLARDCEEESSILSLLDEVDRWRKSRNSALHEMVKVEEETNLSWEDRLQRNREIAARGFRVFVRLYCLIADLNPNHPDRVFTEEERL